MESKKTVVSEFLLQKRQCLLIPPYQRAYSWTQPRWQNLISDIYAKSKSPEDQKQHWIGILIISKTEEQCPFNITNYGHYDIEIIDGQQRILTLMVWLMAIRDHANDNGISVREFEFNEIQCQEVNNFELEILRVPGMWRKRWKTYKNDETGLLHAYTYFRWILWLGKDALERSEEDPLPQSQKGQYSELQVEAQWQRSLEQRRQTAARDDLIEDFDLTLYQSSEELNLQSLIDVTLEYISFLVIERKPEDEPASELFDALNGSRMELQQFDHVRNFIFRGISDKEIRNNLFKKSWESTEIALSKSNIKPSGGINPEDLFLYDFLISLGEARFQKKINRKKTSIHFNRYFESNRNVDKFGKKRNHFEIAEKLLLPSIRYWMLIKTFGEKFEVENRTYYLPSNISKDLIIINSLSTTPVIPLLMHAISDHFEKDLPLHEVELQIKAVRNYLAREVLFGTPLSPLRSEIMALMGKLGQDYKTLDLISMLNERQKTDEQIRSRLEPIPTNTSKNNETKYKYGDFGQILERMKPRQLMGILQVVEVGFAGNSVNHFLEEDPDIKEKFTIEHIYPREPEKWKTDLGKWGVAFNEMNQRTNVLGNLTVVPKRLNSKLNNQTFSRKIAIMKNLENEESVSIPLLYLNNKWIEESKWTPYMIDERSFFLVKEILKNFSN